jgi:hypothetical protein
MSVTPSPRRSSRFPPGRDAPPARARRRTVSRIPQGGTFVEDGSTVRLESSDGSTAVFTFRQR